MRAFPQYPYITGCRKYKADGTFSADIVLPHMNEDSAVDDAKFTLNFETQIVVVDMLPTLPTNIYVRGPNGRFVKWRN